MMSNIRIAAYLAVAIVGASYALDAPLWHGVIMVAVALTPIAATIAWDYYRLRRPRGPKLG